MLNKFVEMLLGAVHEYVPEQYIPLMDVICPPVFVTVILIFVCVLVLRAFSAVYRSVFGGGR